MFEALLPFAGDALTCAVIILVGWNGRRIARLVERLEESDHRSAMRVQELSTRLAVRADSLTARMDTLYSTLRDHGCPAVKAAEKKGEVPEG